MSSVRHCAKYHQNQAETWWFNGFVQNGGCLPSWICWACIETTHNDYLTVSIVVHNYAEIDAVDSIIWKLHYFARLAWRRLFTPPKWGEGLGGTSTPKWGAISTKPQKAHPCVCLRRLSHQACKSVDGSDLQVSSRKKRYKLKNSLHFTHLARSPLWVDLHQIRQSHRDADIISCMIG